MAFSSTASGDRVWFADPDDWGDRLDGTGHPETTSEATVGEAGIV